MTDRPLVLVVDDEPSICWGFESMLRDEGCEVLTASSAERGLQLAATHPISMVLLDVRLPGTDGITALPEFLKATGDASIIVMTAFGDLDTAVQAVRNGASDYITKPFKLDEALQACQRALGQLGRGISTPNSGSVVRSGRSDQLVGASAAMQQAFRQIALVSSSDLSVLITGETGTGKELVAAAIHRHSHRSAGPYLPVAPVAFNEQLIESELFGHVKGAFTGADDDRAGLFEKADGGTILLDEIGDLSMSTQVKLLRVLENAEYSRVGDLELQKANVRILAATNRDLHELVLQGKFREDLYYRLTGVQIHLPPLRERPEDIPALAEHFLTCLQYAASSVSISDELACELTRRPWFGNIRELRNAIEHAAVIARGRPLVSSDFPDPVPGRNESGRTPTSQLKAAVAAWTREKIQRPSEEPVGQEKADSLSASSRVHDELLQAVEPTLIKLVLESTNGNRVKAAELLGIHRGTLRDRIKLYGLK